MHISKVVFFLFVILIVATYLRVSHMFFGMPERYHPDEYFVAKLVLDRVNGMARVERFNHPPLLKNVAFVCAKFFAMLKPVKDGRNYLRVMKVLRGVSVFFGILAVVFLYFLAREFIDEQYALCVAGIYSVLPITVLSSKYGTPDMMLSCLILSALWFQVRLYKTPSLTFYFFNGLFCLLACSAKYNAVFLFLSFGVTHIFVARKYTGREDNLCNKYAILYFLFGIIVGGLLGFPIFKLSGWHNFMSAFVFEFNHLFVKGHYGVQVSGIDYFYMFHWIRSILPSTGYILFVAMLGGVILFLLNSDMRKWIIFSFAIPYYCIIEYIFKVTINYERYVLPLVGIYVLCSVFTLRWVCKWVQAKVAISHRILLYSGMIILCVFPLYRTIRILVSLDPDTRTVAKRWMLSHIPAGSKIAVHWPNSGYYPNLKKMGYTIVEVKPNGQNISDIFFQAEYVIVTSLCYNRYFSNRYVGGVFNEYYKTVFALGTPVFKIEPSYMTYMFHNPVIKIYKIEI